ncbi:MAG TPA: lactate racemase domain-containing protein [Chloroflexota bacterium]
MATWTLDWRNGPLEVAVPDRNLRQVVQAREQPSLGAWPDLVRRAIEDPIGSPPLGELLRPGMRVAIVLTDVHDAMFGGRDRVGPMLLDYLNAAGVPDRDVLLIHAAGLHGHADAREKIGPEVLGRVAYHEHDPLDEGCLTFHGATWQGTPVWTNRLAAERDMMIGFGGCGPSLFGFQGGAGIVLPGISGADTIRQNHIKIMNSGRVISGWWPGNPQRMDVMDAGDLVGFRFKIDVAANSVVAGYFREEWPLAVEYVKENVLTRVAPTDVYVYAPTKSPELANAIYMQLEYGSQVVRPGGVLIACVSAADHSSPPPRPVEETLSELAYATQQWNRDSGSGDPALRGHWRKRDLVCKEELLRLPLEELSRIVVRKLGEPRSTTMAWSHRRCLERTRTFLVTEGIGPEEGAAMGFAYVTSSFEDALGRAFGELGDDAGVVANAGPRTGLPYPLDE